MRVREWKDIPDFMRNDKVKEYYIIIKQKRFSLILKRIFDVIFAIVFLIVLSPVFLLVSICIKIDSKGSIFYRQERVTQYGKVFRIFKFRTMVTDADKKGGLVTTQNDARITRVGKRIRKYRLDEIPQLLNILIGDMSFVGTRPEVQKYVDTYTDEMKATLLLPAGVTSEASIEYKDEDRLLMKMENADEIYIKKILPEKMIWNLNSLENYSFLRELCIVVRTIFVLIFR